MTYLQQFEAELTPKLENDTDNTTAIVRWVSEKVLESYSTASSRSLAISRRLAALLVVHAGWFTSAARLRFATRVIMHEDKGGGSSDDRPAKNFARMHEERVHCPDAQQLIAANAALRVQNESLETYLRYTGQVDAEGRKFSTNTEVDGRFHSKWINMMPDWRRGDTSWRNSSTSAPRWKNNGVDHRRARCQDSAMSLIDLARDTLKEIPMADILRERLSLALDQFAESVRQNAKLQGEIGSLHTRLQNAEIDRDKAQQELKRLQKEHEEEMVIHKLLEFRRGKRTRNRWVPFCSVCHAPAGINPQPDQTIAFCIGDCSKKKDGGLIAYFEAGTTLESLVAEVEKLPI